ncbi:MAG: UpxY family transcription antiterminator [Sediminibacterium sp.]
MEQDNKWYALYTKPRWEKKIHASLIRKNIESWCPVKRIENQWTDRKKKIDEPIFKSYIFVRIDIKNRTPVLMTDGVLNFVHYLGKPAVIRDEEVQIIKQYLSEKDAILTLQSLQAFEETTKVLVTYGVFMDKVGTVIKKEKKKIYVKLQSLGQVMVVEFPIDYLEPMF